MASVANVRLSITPLLDGNVTVEVQYQIQGTALDVATQRYYREICELVGRDTTTSSDVGDQVLRTIYSQGIMFSHAEAEDRTVSTVLLLSTLDEDAEFANQEDEICAKVRLVKYPPHEYSNLVRIGGVAPPIA
jgi:hypothetical protein